MSNRFTQRTCATLVALSTALHAGSAPLTSNVMRNRSIFLVLHF